MQTKTLIVLLGTAMTATVFAGGRFGRIAISCDGNFHDRDDINSSGWELAIFAQAGRAQDVVYFGYADHYWESDGSMESDMSTSVAQAASDWDYDASVLHDTHTDPTAAVGALAAEINKSTASNPLTVIEAGPAELIGLALVSSNSNARRYLTVISHSSWNNVHAKRYGPQEGLPDKPYGFGDFPGLGAKTLMIPFQQALNGCSYNAFAWAKNSKDIRLQHLYERGVAAGKPAFDCSDSGMAYYVVTGDTAASAVKYKILFNQ